MKQFIENGNFLRTVYTVILIFIAMATIVGWKITSEAYEKFLTKEDYIHDQNEINSQLHIIRKDIKSILRAVK